VQAARVKVRNGDADVLQRPTRSRVVNRMMLASSDGTVRYDDADIRPMAVALGVGSEPLVGVMNSSASCGFEWFTFVH